jgi:L-lactate dehydrogenase complex protein LldG
MKESTQKEKVLKQIRDALVNEMRAPFEQTDAESSVFLQPQKEFQDISFAEAFSSLGGKFVFCASTEELAGNLKAIVKNKQLHKLFCAEPEIIGLLKNLNIHFTQEQAELSDCDAALTFCEALVGRLGSIVMSSRLGGSRRAFTLPPVHIVIATSNQLVPDIRDAFQLIQQKYQTGLPSMISFVTGPSRTADIEKKLVKGVHGPKELYLLLLDSPADVI